MIVPLYSGINVHFPGPERLEDDTCAAETESPFDLVALGFEKLSHDLRKYVALGKRLAADDDRLRSRERHEQRAAQTRDHSTGSPSTARPPRTKRHAARLESFLS